MVARDRFEPARGAPAHIRASHPDRGRPLPHPAAVRRSHRGTRVTGATLASPRPTRKRRRAPRFPYPWREPRRGAGRGGRRRCRAPC